MEFRTPMLVHRPFSVSSIALMASFLIGCTASTPPPASPPTISGSAFYKKSEGGSELLRGLEIIACKASTKPEFDKLYQEHYTKKESSFQDIKVTNLLLASAFMQVFASRSPDCLKTLKTDSEAKYKITGLPPGDYLLFSQYSTDTSSLYWLIPVTLSSEPIVLDISNDNAAQHRWK